MVRTESFTLIGTGFNMSSPTPACRDGESLVGGKANLETRAEFTPRLSQGHGESK